MKEIKDNILMVSTSEIKPHESSHNTDEAVEMIKESLSMFGIQQPIIIDSNNVVVAGNAIYRASVEIGINEVPCIKVDDLTDEEVAQYRIADNKTGEFARWNERKLKSELSYLADPNELQFCFDENVMQMIGMAQPVQNQKPTSTNTPASPQRAKPLSVDDIMESEDDETYAEDSIEDDMVRKAYQEQINAQREERERISKEKKEARFNEQVKDMSTGMVAKPTEYFEYACGKCGKTVRVRAK